MKVSNWVHFTKIWVTIATKWRHAPFFIRPNNLPPEIIGTFRLDYEYEIEYEYDFRISNR